jgi:hypothetical protein
MIASAAAMLARAKVRALSPTSETLASTKVRSVRCQSVRKLSR